MMTPQAAAASPDGQTAQARQPEPRARQVYRGDAVVAVLLPACGAALAWAGWLIGGSDRTGAPVRWHSYADLLGLAAAAAGLMILAWWGLGLLLAVAGTVLHRTGYARMAAAAFAASPAFLRRLVAAVLGLHLLAAPAASASVPISGAGPAGPAVPAASAHDSGPADPYFSVPDRPTPGRSTVAVDPSWQPAGRVPDPGRQPGPATVVVRAGDTLWDIAARDLGGLATDAEVAGHWPRWYAANRAVIGADPALLLPGQVLSPPSKR
jgi:nucleoid-associated protein YgaU